MGKNLKTFNYCKIISVFSRVFFQAKIPSTGDLPQEKLGTQDANGSRSFRKVERVCCEVLGGRNSILPWGPLVWLQPSCCARFGCFPTISRWFQTPPLFNGLFWFLWRMVGIFLTPKRRQGFFTWDISGIFPANWMIIYYRSQPLQKPE